MGFFKEIFSGRKEYPELDAASPAARQLAEFRNELEQLSHDINDNLEIVPGQHRAFVFIGKPPKRFGLAWIEDHEIKNLKSYADEHDIAPGRMTRIVDNVRTAYEQSQEEQRFGTRVGDKQVVVAPSTQLEQEMERIITNTES